MVLFWKAVLRWLQEICAVFGGSIISAGLDWDSMNSSLSNCSASITNCWSCHQSYQRHSFEMDSRLPSWLPLSNCPLPFIASSQYPNPPWPELSQSSSDAYTSWQNQTSFHNGCLVFESESMVVILNSFILDFSMGCTLGCWSNLSLYWELLVVSCCFTLLLSGCVLSHGAPIPWGR